MKFRLLGGLFAALLLASPAAAADYLFEITGYHEASFVLPASPTPAFAGDSNFGVLDVPLEMGGATIVVRMNFFAVGAGGGFDVNGPNGPSWALFGPEQVFAGPTATPTFVPGSYVFFEFNSDFRQVYVAISEAPAGVPEPATWAAMITGFGLAGGALRRRRRTLA